MGPSSRCHCMGLLLAVSLLGGHCRVASAVTTGIDTVDTPPAFVGSKAGDEREVAGIQLCWCPAGRFLMGSPPSEPERRPDEDQVEVTLTKGFWTGKYEVTQGQWKRVMGKVPGEPTAELPEGDDFPVDNVNFAEAEGFCRKLTEQARASGDSARGVGIPAADRGAVGVRLPGRDHDGHGVRRQAEQQPGELQGQPYNGAEPGPSLEPGGQSRQLPGERLGAARHARQHLRVVPGLVSPETTRAATIRTCTRPQAAFAGAPGRLLGGRGLAVPVGLARCDSSRSGVATTSAFASSPSNIK